MIAIKIGEISVEQDLYQLEAFNSLSSVTLRVLIAFLDRAEQ
jgi:hypothetical protein